MSDNRGDGPRDPNSPPPKLVSLKVWRWRGAQGSDTNAENAVEVADYENLSFMQFFHRPVAREQLRFHCRVVVSRTELGQRQSIQLEEGVGYCHTWVHPSGLAATVVTDKNYPLRVAYTLLSEMLKLFLMKFPNKEAEQQAADTTNMIGQLNPEGQELFDKFQDPETADKIFKIERDLEGLKEVMMKNMDDLMARGETLESLEDKSSDLSAMGKKFAREAKKQNSCCDMG